MLVWGGYLVLTGRATAQRCTSNGKKRGHAGSESGVPKPRSDAIAIMLV